MTLLDKIRTRLFPQPEPKPLLSDMLDLQRIIKSNNAINNPWDSITPVPIENRHYVDVTKDTEALRRAIHTISAYYNTLGVYREDFNKEDSDRLSRNAHYAMCEKAMLDYISTVEFEVRDDKGKGQLVKKPMEFLDAPNPQSDFQDLLKPAVRDTIRYDAGVWVKSFNRAGFLTEIKSYLGTEFWKEMDRAKMHGGLPGQMTDWQSFWSHGYTKRYWQRARIGLFVPYHPEEITYFMMYPRSDGIYGTDFLKTLRFQIQYLIDSTRAAGKTFDNGIVPSLVWSHPDVFSREQLTQKMAEIEASNKGSYNFGGVLHTVASEEVKTISSTLVDMQWLEGQKYVAALIWGMWGFSSSEFIDSDTNRANAYVSRNITKSRMLRPILKYVERKINREVLPYMKGYKKDWNFKFVSDTDLSEELQMAQINATKSSAVSSYVNMGLKPSLAMKLAHVGDDLTTAEREHLDKLDIQDEEFNSGMPLKTDGTPNNTDSHKYMPVDLNQGRYNRSDGSSSANPDYSDAPDETDRDRYETRDLKKGKKVYIRDPNTAPKGANVQRGDRGGYYYIKEEDQERNRKDQPERKRGRKRDDEKNGRGRGSGMNDDPTGVPTSPEDGKANGEQDKKFHLSGEGVSIVVFDKHGKVVAYAINTDETEKMVELLVRNTKTHDYMGYLESAVKVAEQKGLKLEVN